jgi:cytochrome b6-f complex iron-sulfur subunit
MAMKTSQPGQTRRSFLNKIWIGFAALGLAQIAALVIVYLRPGKKTEKSAGAAAVIEAGPVDGFEPASVTAFVRGRFYLARLADGGFLALSSKCTHLGCTVPWDPQEKQFACPCHASAFDIRGEVLSAPAPRALDLYHLFIENNVVKVDTNRLFKRDLYDRSQVTYPEAS